MLRSWRSFGLNCLVGSVRAIGGAIGHIVLFVHIPRLIMYQMPSAGAVSKHTLDVVVFMIVLVRLRALNLRRTHIFCPATTEYRRYGLTSVPCLAPDAREHHQLADLARESLRGWMLI